MNLPDDDELLREGIEAEHGYEPDDAKAKDTRDTGETPTGPAFPRSAEELHYTFNPKPEERTPEEWREVVTQSIKETFPPRELTPHETIGVNPFTVQGSPGLFTQKDLDLAVKKAVAAKSEEFQKFLERVDKEDPINPDPRLPIREQILRWENEVEKRYPFRCATEPCTARVMVEGSTCSLHGSLPPMPETILQEAQRLVHGDRNKAYGSPDENHTATADLFNEWLNARTGKAEPRYLDAYDVCVFNMLQKLSRTAHQLRTQGRPHRDSLVDIAGYAENMNMINAERETLEGGED